MAKRRKSERQYIWEYMRRNRVVAIESILTIFDLSRASLQKFIKELENGGYIVAQRKRGKVPHRFEDRSYVLVKNSGALVPRYIKKQGVLYDPNTGQRAFKSIRNIAREKRERKYKLGGIIKLLQDGAKEYGELLKLSHYGRDVLDDLLKEWMQLEVIKEVDGSYSLIEERLPIAYERLELRSA